ILTGFRRNFADFSDRLQDSGARKEQTVDRPGPYRTRDRPAPSGALGGFASCRQQQLIGYVASGLVLLDWLPPVLGLNLLVLPLHAVRLVRRRKPGPATRHTKSTR